MRSIVAYVACVMLAFRGCSKCGAGSAMRYFGWLGGALLIVALGACTPSIRGTPERLLDVPVETELIRTLAGPEWYAEYARSTGARRRELRDQIVLARMYAIDLYYSEYEANLTRERQNVGFLSTVANLALTSSATLVAAKETKTILSAVATGLTGAKEAYDKEILIEKTIAILQQQMRARRKEIKVSIIGRLSLDQSSYPLELALTDVESYYRAGTITGALIDVSEETGVRLAQARAIEERIVVTRFAPVADLGTRIRAFVRVSAANLRAVQDYLASNHPGTAIAEFVRVGSRPEQLRMIQQLNIP